jgi:hypothetical protein
VDDRGARFSGGHGGGVACKWVGFYSREQFLSSLEAGGRVVMSVGRELDNWSTEWPFHNVQRPTLVYLREGSFAEEDVGRLRRSFPGVSLFVVGDEAVTGITGRPLDPALEQISLFSVPYASHPRSDMAQPEAPRE